MATSASTKSDATRRWRQKHPEAARALRTAWRAKNPDKVKASGRLYYQKNKDRVKERSRQWRARNPELARSRAKAKHLSRTYGLTLDAFAALLRGQGGRCAVCRALDGDWVVDHDHKTGVVRGVLCRQCNLGLGAFADNPDSLLSAAKYLMVR